MRQTTLHRLNAKAAKSLGDGWHADGGGLYLRVKGNTRSWVFRWTEGAKKREKAIGPAASVALATARQRAAEAREALAEGNTPVVRKKAAEPAPKVSRTPTLGEAARDYIGARRATWSNKKHAMQWQASLDLHAADLLKMPIDQITSSDVADTLSPIWLTKIETASRVRQRIERILGACIARGERPGPNPAALRDNLDVILPDQKRVRKVKGHAAIPWQDAPAAFAAIWARRHTGIGYSGLITCALTALRSGEIRHLQWD
ncbi:MAG: Arm DNA-binding domain-containing protein, partial [Aestuariivita sp.]|uniref:tyrosine-type recombinase/integrase n=1 Tax=Aestuariivita sp. TaxID=1872407 RepID=UPI003BAE6324